MARKRKKATRTTKPKPPGGTAKQARAPKSPPRKTSDNPAYKFKIRGKDNTPLTNKDLQQGLYDIAKQIEARPDIRAKWATLYIPFIDENGQATPFDEKCEQTIWPYRTGADEHGA